MEGASLGDVLGWEISSQVQVLASIIAVLVYFLITRFAFPRIEKSVEDSKLRPHTRFKAFNVIRLLSGIITLTALLMIWGFDFSGLLLVTTSIITVTGIALFASWSILSNITAYLVLLMHPSYRRGNFVRIIEADNYIEGYIAEVNIFNTRLITETREVVIYPNNLLISRPTLINPRSRLFGVGKIKEPPAGIDHDTPGA